MVDVKLLVKKDIPYTIEYYIGKQAKINLDIFDINENGYSATMHMVKNWTFEDFHKLLLEACTKCKNLPAEIFIVSIILLDVN